ncbi:hypothetical protein F1654_10615 [Alkalicaulis satelles]|uniref:Uncharacterized protein n=1 Tax=Alkalicaulis satelles TaxID=2609175 RepID=A0A5M6ZEG9_9PROT|nr:hypothetical protein [Alkalicaulis satelles]KAA5802274.1 hypothetical protein F1654_10615 [Alkalicaulis satelles]
MSLVILIASAAALSLDPGLSGAPVPAGAGPAPYNHEPRSVARAVSGADTRTVTRTETPWGIQGRPDHAAASHAASRAVQLSPGFFQSPLTGGVERPPVQVYWVRHGYVIHGARHAPVSAGQAAAARGLGQGGTP